MKGHSKYHNKRVRVDNFDFASQREAQRYKSLQLLVKAGKIENLKLQMPFELVPAQYEMINGKKKCVERAVKYVADFVYFDKEKGELVVEDAKGVKTDVYKLKRKLMRSVYGIEIQEV